MCSASSTKTSSTPARTRCSAALRPERPPPTMRIWTSGCMEHSCLLVLILRFRKRSLELTYFQAQVVLHLSTRGLRRQRGGVLSTSSLDFRFFRSVGRHRRSRAPCQQMGIDFAFFKTTMRAHLGHEAHANATTDTTL